MINETLYLANYLLTETELISPEMVLNAYKKAYPESTTGARPLIATLTPEAIESGVLDAVKDDSDFVKNSPMLKTKSQKLAAAIRVINKSDFVAAIPAEKSTEKDLPDVKDSEEPKVWPKYAEFRKKWYLKTTDMGWPKDITADTSEQERQGRIIFPWNNKATAYSFGPRGSKLGIINYTKGVKNELYKRFHNDVQGLQKLLNLVSSIVDVEKTYFGGRPVLNFMGMILSAAFRGIGGTSNDEQIIKWLFNKAKGMTIFEYQKFILEEMYTKMSLDDTTLQDLKNMLNPIRAITMKIEGYEPTQVKGEYSSSIGFMCSFKVESKVKSGKETFEAQAYLDVLDHLIIPLSEGKLSKGGTWDDAPKTPELYSYKRMLLRLKEKGARGESILRVIPKIFFIRHKRIEGKVENSPGDYIIQFKYMPYRVIIQISYKPNGESDE